MVINGINFDNTLSVKKQAEAIEKSGILDKNIIGKQKQLFKIGDTVNTNGATKATITDAWSENGFIYYQVSWTIKRKTYTKNARQQDITLIKEA